MTVVTAVTAVTKVTVLTAELYLQGAEAAWDAAEAEAATLRDQAAALPGTRFYRVL